MSKRKFVSTRAQSSIETLIILATALFILTALVSMVYDQLNSSYIQQQQKSATAALGALAGEINDAYFLGPGTVKNVTIILPDLIDFNKSFIKGRALVLSVGRTDYVFSTKVEVRGSWPNSDGSHVFAITAYDDYVGISNQSVSFSPSQINLAIPQSNQTDVNVVITNNTSKYSTYSVKPEVFSTNEGFLFESDAQSIDVLPNGEGVVDFNFSCSSTSFGAYTGRIVFEPESSSDFNLSIPVNVICFINQSKLAIFPAQKQISIGKNESLEESFLICNNSSGDLQNISVSFTGALLNHASIKNIPKSVSTNNCEKMTVALLSGSTDGTFSGTIRVYSGGYFTVSNISLVVS